MNIKPTDHLIDYLLEHGPEHVLALYLWILTSGFLWISVGLWPAVVLLGLIPAALFETAMFSRYLGELEEQKQEWLRNQGKRH